jgi:ATP:corrinoid adenosyltransferase
MSEQDAWKRIKAYLTENKVKMVIMDKLQQKMVIGTIKKDAVETINEEPKEIMVECQKLDCIFYDEPLGFEKDPSFETKKI